MQRLNNKKLTQEYREVNLVSDPIYGYIRYTKRNAKNGDLGEQSIIDHPWMQRTRRIRQLQCAWWIFPGAEHSRLTHLLGSMHLAGEWSKHLYKTLKEVCPEAPSSNLVEETLRMAGLLHDVGHGPFGHFFDEQYLRPMGVDHEMISQKIILEELGELLQGIKSSPSGLFEKGEKLDPRWVAYSISVDGLDGFNAPKWLELLRPVINGRFAADNMDYVPRDAYACGVKTVNVDAERIIHYTFVTPKGIALHKRGLEAVALFLTARIYMYSNIYKHRMAQRIDLHLKEIFLDTFNEILGGINPMDDLERFMETTDWSLMEETYRWQRAKAGSKRALLAREWANINGREEQKWKMVFENTFGYQPLTVGNHQLDFETFLSSIQKRLPEKLQNIKLELDLTSLVSRPQDKPHPASTFLLYDPLDDSLVDDAVKEVVSRLQLQTTLMRIYAVVDGPEEEELRQELSKLWK
jgi:HD superfamily phosphohydrolase